MSQTAFSPSSRRAVFATQRGYLYVLRFDNEVVKAGRTANLLQRRSRHRSEAGRFNLTVTAEWCSEELDQVQLYEKCLLKVLAAIGTRTGAGREYFRGIPFSVARYQAERVHQLRLNNCCCGTCVEPAPMHTTVRMAGEPHTDPADEGRVIFDARLPCGAVISASFEDVFESEEKERLRRGGTFDIELDPCPWQGRWLAWLK
jgi:hypothetical protein